MISNKSIKKKKIIITIVFRLLTIFIICKLILVNGIKNISFQKGNINMLFIGEKISYSSVLLNFKLNINNSLFILHGLFLDVIESMIAFKLFGQSIGSFLFFDTLLLVISFGFFLFFLSYIIKNNLLFIISTFFFLFTQLKFRIINTFFLILYLWLSIFILEKNKPSFLYIFCQFLLVFISFFYSVETAYYQLILHFFFIFFNKKNSSKIHLLKNIIFFFVLFLLFFSLFRFFRLNDFLVMYFKNLFILTKMTSYIFKPDLQSITIKNLNIYSFPLILSFWELIFLIYLKNKIKLNISSKYFFIYSLGIINLYGIYSRINSKFLDYDRANISYFLYPQFIIFFLIIDLLIKHRYYKKAIFFIVISSFFISPFLYYNSLFQGIKGLSNIKNFFNLTKVKDSVWFNNEQKKVILFIKKNTNQKDFVFVFNNESLYYYAFNRRNPTRFYITSLAEPIEFQKEVIRNLSIKKPKYVIYSSNNESSDLDNIPQSLRLYLINQYLLKFYKKSIKIGSTQILSY